VRRTVVLIYPLTPLPARINNHYTQLHITTRTPPYPAQYTAPYKNRAKLWRTGALDKALDTWYNTGVGLKETHKTGA